MRTEDLLEQCLQALTSGQELPPELARYLALHPEQQAEVEDLLFLAQRVSRLPSAELPPDARRNMQARLAKQLGFDPNLFAASAHYNADMPTNRGRKKPLFSMGRLSLVRLRYEPPANPPEDAEARIRAAFRDLTPEDIRRYIGVRGESYLYYRQRFPGWEPLFMMLALILRGFKRIERLMSTG